MNIGSKDSVPLENIFLALVRRNKKILSICPCSLCQDLSFCRTLDGKELIPYDLDLLPRCC